VSRELALLGWDDAWADAFAPYAETATPARIARVDRTAVDVLTADAVGLRRMRVETDHTDDVVTGDWIAMQPSSEFAGATIDGRLPRRTTIRRAAATGRSEPQVIAANIDLVLICLPVFPEPKPGLVERLLALAWDSGATPLVVVTKADLHPEAAAIAANVAETAPGVDVVLVDAVHPGGADSLMPHVTAGRTVALIGKSGAGKSTLANALAGSEVAATGEIRDDGKGRHTTTHRELIPLPSGAVLLDTPGLRGAGLWVTEDGLDQAFAEIDALVDECRFADCAHRTEPSCAVLAAVDDGRIPQRRLESWRKLQREVLWMASRTDARLRSEQRRAWKIVSQEVRRSGRIRP